MSVISDSADIKNAQTQCAGASVQRERIPDYRIMLLRAHAVVVVEFFSKNRPCRILTTQTAAVAVEALALTLNRRFTQSS